MEVKEIVDKSGHIFRVKRYDGVTFRMHVPGNVSNHLEKIGQLEYFSDDTVVLSYPKSGTHWAMEIANMIRKGKAEYHEKDNIAWDFYDSDRIMNVASPRVYATHLRPRHLPKTYLQDRRKIVYVYRNPKDVAVSMFNFFRKLNTVNYAGKWEDFIDVWLYGNAIDSWFDFTKNVEEFIKENPDYPILVVSYENMKKDFLKEVRQIADFLEPGTSDELCGEIAKKCEFSVMNKAKNENVPLNIQKMSKDGNHIFYRKGDVGDWKNWFTFSMNEAFDKEYRERMRGFDIGMQFTID